MPMFKKNLKLIATAIGLVTVLVMGLAMPGATQQNPLTRQAVVQGIDSALAAFTAAEGDVWDTQCTQFYSTPRFTLAFVPLHPSSRSLQMLLTKDARNITLEALYIPEDIPGFLRAGTYLVKIEDPNVNPARILVVDQEGNIVYTTTAKIERSNTPKPELYKPCFPATVELSNPKVRIVEKCYFWCLIKITETVYEW
jgi:hypothetical protein